MLKTNVMQSIIVIVVSLLISITASITVANAANPGLPVIDFDLTTGSSHQGLPEYYPASFQAAGAIHALRSGNIIITGHAGSFSLSTNVLVHSVSTEFAPRNELRAGKEVGFSFNKGMGNKRTITEIWVLPHGTIKPQ